jgi:small redox-active disulfide protein 2
MKFQDTYLHKGVIYMKIKILGTGCPKCNKLEANTREALKQSGISAEIQKVTDINDIMKYGMVVTPALVIDEELKSSGKVLSSEQIRKYLSV